MRCNFLSFLYCWSPLFSCRLFVLILILTSSQSIVNPQSTSATLMGTVEDQNGAVVVGANVTVLNVSTRLQREATTNDQGYFIVALLPPSTYTVTVRRDGFAPTEFPNVVLNVGDQKSLQIQLKAGIITEMVKVEGDAPLINESPAVATTIDRQFVANLPLNGRSFQSLITLTPGVVLTKAVGSERGQFSVNGQRANANYFMVDGVGANIDMTPGIGGGQRAGGALPGLSATGGTNNLVAVDALQEFQIQTSTYAPEFGRMSGAQISIVTRSGTNQYHGTLFEYFRNEALDANDWFANRAGIRRPALRQHDFGGVLGGPIIKDRTFFFFSYEGLRLRLPQVGITEVPSVTSRTSAPARIQPLLNAFPVPNGIDTGGGFARFTTGYSDSSNFDATSIRLDQSISDKLTIFGRYNHAPSELVTRGVSGNSLVSLSQLSFSAFKTQTFTLGGTLIVNPQISNDLRFNYSRNMAATIILLDDFGGAEPPADSEFLPPFASREDSRFGLFIGRSAFSLGLNAENLQRQVNVVDNLSVVKGPHQLKFGVDWRWLSPVAGPTLYAIDIEGTLAGIATSASINSREGEISLLYKQFSAYGQHTWKVTPLLTLTYGVRWEVSTPPKGRDGKDIFTVIGLDSPSTIALAPQGTPLWETTYAKLRSPSRRRLSIISRQRQRDSSARRFWYFLRSRRWHKCEWPGAIPVQQV